MRNFLLILAAAASIAFLSCDDNVNPKSEVKNEYALFCIINCDTTFQTAYLSKSYDVAGLDPLENTTDPAVTGASLKIEYVKDSESKLCMFKDSSAERTLNSRYTGPVRFYVSNDVDIKSPHLYGVPIPVYMTAVLPGGKTLTASGKSIPTGDLLFTNIIREYSPETSPKSGLFKWEFLSGRNNEKDYCYRPALIIKYSKIENGVPVPKTVEVPYFTSYNQDIPVLSYPGINSNNSIIYRLAYIKETLEKISEGDNQKSNYIIHALQFELRIMSKELAEYCAAGSTFKDEFSVRIDSPDITNVRGGLGIFGIYSTKKASIDLDQNLIGRLGYRYQPINKKS